MSPKEQENTKLSDIEKRISEIQSNVGNIASDQNSNKNAIAEQAKKLENLLRQAADAAAQETIPTPDSQQGKSFGSLVEYLKKAEPSWQKNGGGVRGNQPTTQETRQNLSQTREENLPRFNFQQIAPPESQVLETLEAPAPATTETREPSCENLALYTKDGDVWIGPSSVAGQLPSGFNELDGKFIANSGSGNVYCRVTINENTGAIVSRSVESGQTIPDDSETSFYFPLGYYEYSGNPPSAKLSNYGCGAVGFSVCRNWFVSQPPFFTSSFTR